MGQQQRKRLTKRQQAVLDLLTKELMWPSEISRRLHITKQAVSKHIERLRKKGLVGGVDAGMVDTRCTLQGVMANVNLLRLHGEEYRVGIIMRSKHYDLTRTRANSVFVEGNRVVLYRDVLMVFSSQSFYGPTVEDCERQAVEYWVRFFHRLESLYNVLVLKDRKENVKRVKAHYGETNNELADDFRRRKERCRVFGSRDGKEWLLFDDSAPDGVGLAEAETTHSSNKRDDRDALEDMREVVQPLFNDLRDKRPALPSVIQEAVERSLKHADVTQQQLAELAEGLNGLVKLLTISARAGLPPEEKKDDKKEKRPDYFG
jgi:DNA-binding Lrp family transcriptional regulator